MIVKSMYPPMPPLPPTNYFSWVFDQPPGNALPKDHVLHIDALTGAQRTYGEFLESVRDAATAFVTPTSQGGLGMIPGTNGKEIVGILSENCLDYIVLVYACMFLAIPFAPLPSHPTLAELTYLMGKSSATRLFVQPSLMPLASKAAADVKLPKDRIYLLDGRAAGMTGLTELIENVRRKKIPRHAVVPAGTDTLAYLLFSSGTSGLPKAVMISHGNLCFSLAQHMLGMQEIVKASPPAEGPPIMHQWLCFLPFYHAYPLHYFMFRTFIIPQTMIILPRWNLDQAIAAIPKYKITFIAAVPSIIHQLVHSEKFRATDVSTLKVVGSGASYLPPALAKELVEIVRGDVQVPEGYGLSEATISAMSRPLPGLLGGLQPVPNSTGILLPGLTGRIVREDGSDADYDEPGELWLKGPNVALGYWGDEKATRDTFRDGWVLTGDRFHVDKNGVFYFNDRLKDTLKISGAQVSPAEIEAVLLSEPHRYIIDVAVCGVDGGGRTADEKVPRAWVVLGPGGKQVDGKEVTKALEEWVQQNLSKFKWLRGGIEITEEIPKNPTGKVLRRVLQENYNKRNTQKAKL